ncbi:MAG: tRNA (guanosine(46)-N7)-methyltransferase TrmB [Bacteroidales bacterium]|nr:tRNA (guanosine(46)-N7)-methyltransferase TrmB [Bacteroidales bacterium]
MGHGKLKKFAENETFACLLQPDAPTLVSHDAERRLILHDHPVKGRWNGRMFPADQPVVLELGCGKGEYTLALAARHPEHNYIGVDIKGARLWKGAKQATAEARPNVAFLRSRIEFLPALFAPGEVSEIWLTFSDPQLKSENARLTSPVFLERYRQFLAPGGIIHLKTDSRFLHEYTAAVVRANGLELLASGTDIYREGFSIFAAGGETAFCACPAGDSDAPEPVAARGFMNGRGPQACKACGRDEDRRSEGFRGITVSGPLTDTRAVFEVQTFYESMFLKMGLPITYMAFRIDKEGPYVHPVDFDADYWRAAEGPRRTFSHQPAKGSD